MTTDTTPETSLPLPSLSRILFGIAVDFALGLALFAIVFAGVSLGHGEAIAGPAGWVTTVAPDPIALVTSDFGQVVSERTSAMIVLAVAFAAITALNLSIARHVHAVAVPARHLDAGFH